MDKLSEFVKEQIKSGVNTSELKDHLVRNGWKEEDVNSAISNVTGKRAKNRVFIAVLGVILVGLLALALISFAKNSTSNIPSTNQPSGNNNAESLVTFNPVDECAGKEDSMEKDECYKEILSSKSDFECESLADNVEYTYCTRAYEETALKGVEVVEES